jgi:dTDP-4-amino-4,6-dideoxygalactose transaminase
MPESQLALAGGKPTISREAHVRWPVLGEEERMAVLRVLDRGVLSGPFAPEVRALEKEWATYLGRRYALATNSGTASIHLALAAEGVEPGDEVITSAYSFVATALAVLHQNATPVFVDIEPETCGLDPQKIEAAITPRTKAILPVHVHGTPCRITEVMRVANAHGLTVIEDAAQAHGAELDGRKVGTFGRSACFSVQSSKNLSAGEGGLFVTDDEDAYTRAFRMRSFGEGTHPDDERSYRIERALDGPRAYDAITIGWMYRTTELSAAVARAQLQKLDRFNGNARANAGRLSSLLSRLPGVEPIFVSAPRTSCIHKYRVRLDAKKIGIDASPRRVRDAMLRALTAEGAECVLWQTMPVPGQKLFRDRFGYDPSRYPETVRLLDASIVLFSQTCPIYPQPLELVEAYAEAFEKVWSRLDEVLALVGEG